MGVCGISYEDLPNGKSITHLCTLLLPHLIFSIKLKKGQNPHLRRSSWRPKLLMWLCFQFYYPREVLTQLYQGTCLRIFLQGFFVCLFFFFALAVAGSHSEPRCVSLGNKQTKCVGCIPWDTRRQQEARSQVPAWLARVLVWAGQAWFLPFAMAYYYSFKIYTTVKLI